MVQEFHIIRCFSCETFQVHQVKKGNKWNCKLCGAKQSVRKEYGRGTGVDCRRHVQKLNMMRASQDSAPPPCDDQEDSQQEWQESTVDSTAPQYTDDGQKPSKWEKFVTTSDKPDDKDPSDSEDTQFTTDKNRFQRRKRKGKGHGERMQSYTRQGKRQRCQGAFPDESAATCTDWQFPTTEQENSPMFHDQRGYPNTSHSLWYKSQQQDFAGGNTEPRSTAQPTWQHLHTSNMTHSTKVALPETSKREVEEREEVKQFGNEENWKDVDKVSDDVDKNVNRRIPQLAGQGQKGQRSLPSSSVSSSRWSKFTSKAVNVDDDDDDEAQEVESYGYRSNRPNDSTSCLGTQYTATEGNGRRLKEVWSCHGDDPALQKYNHSSCHGDDPALQKYNHSSCHGDDPALQKYNHSSCHGDDPALQKYNHSSCHGDDPALQKYNHPMAKPCGDPQEDENTRMTSDVQTCREVPKLRTAGFSTGEDLDEVLGEDFWDL